MADPTASRHAPEVFRSGVDLRIVFVILLGTVGALAAVMAAPSTNAGLGKDAAIVIAATVAALVLGLFWWTYRSTAYTLHDDTLDVRCGGLHWRVACRDITRVEFTNSVRSAPALSLRRLRVCYGESGGLVISPRDREAFIEALRRRVPGMGVGQSDS